jgi:hypothetical protein
MNANVMDVKRSEGKAVLPSGYTWRFRVEGGKHWRVGGGVAWLARTLCAMVVGPAGTVGGYSGRGWEKTSFFCHKRSPNCDFSVLPRSFHPIHPITYDGWVRRERYGGSDLGEKSFQLSSLLIIYIWYDVIIPVRVIMQLHFSRAVCRTADRVRRISIVERGLLPCFDSVRAIRPYLSSPASPTFASDGDGPEKNGVGHAQGLWRAMPLSPAYGSIDLRLRHQLLRRRVSHNPRKGTTPEPSCSYV